MDWHWGQDTAVYPACVMEVFPAILTRLID